MAWTHLKENLFQDNFFQGGDVSVFLDLVWKGPSSSGFST